MKKLIGSLLAAVLVAASLTVQAQTLVNDTHKSALILIEFQNDWMALWIQPVDASSLPNFHVVAKAIERALDHAPSG
ncbi:hypothetical protein [Pseudomonas typographi]|uniref:Isochorismatase n=1 Tax=Pseudomonas typographi TaxID=2715964 RepID=A0ABR7Z842_9PSED|nr:hypothetical protein [Pseudomonas typographi]MBD1550734.1 hypothetical protein [Pseudomonas typographi]MBD1601634.1 hypothetical protein [Pseudomonas typographi]